MENNQLFIYNTLTPQEGTVRALHAPHVGMYCVWSYRIR